MGFSEFLSDMKRKRLVHSLVVKDSPTCPPSYPVTPPCGLKESASCPCAWVSCKWNVMTWAGDQTAFPFPRKRTAVRFWVVLKGLAGLLCVDDWCGVYVIGSAYTRNPETWQGFLLGGVTRIGSSTKPVKHQPTIGWICPWWARKITLTSLK